MATRYAERGLQNDIHHYQALKNDHAILQTIIPYKKYCAETWLFVI